jgi:RNA polymerase sigma-70 factor (ECF subfamily)
MQDSGNSSITSPSLVARVKEHDPAAWERLCRIYTPLIYSWVSKLEITSEDVADIVQEVFQAVASSISSFEHEVGRPPFRSWLYGITRHKTLDYFRKRKKHPLAQGGTEANRLISEIPEFEICESTEDGSSANRLDQFAFRALQIIKTDFQETTWRAFCLTAIENLSAIEVSEKLGISVGAVYTAKSRVLAHLRSELKDLWRKETSRNRRFFLTFVEQVASDSKVFCKVPARIY